MAAAGSFGLPCPPDSNAGRLRNLVGVFRGLQSALAVLWAEAVENAVPRTLQATYVPASTRNTLFPPRLSIGSHRKNAGFRSTGRRTPSAPRFLPERPRSQHQCGLACPQRTSRARGIETGCGGGATRGGEAGEGHGGEIRLEHFFDCESDYLFWATAAH
jgi:hypothetical protein